MASIEKTSFGTWRASVSVKYKRATKTFKTKGEAQAWASHTEAGLRQDKPVISDMLLSKLMDRYVEEVSSKKKGERWERVRVEAFKAEFTQLCNTPISKIKRSDLVSLRDKRLKTVSPATVNRELNLLSHIFSTAVHEWQLIPESPMHRLKRPEEPPPRDRLPTQAETDAILHALDYSEEGELTSISSRVAAAWLFAIETGMRAKEICRLSPADIVGRVANVRESKTRTGIRGVPLSATALSILDRLKRVDIEGDSVFHLTPSQIDSLFRKAKKRTGIEDLHFHDSRAEAITRLSKKVDILTLARIVGHKDLRMLQVYYRESAEDIAERL